MHIKATNSNPHSNKRLYLMQKRFLAEVLAKTINYAKRALYIFSPPSSSAFPVLVRPVSVANGEINASEQRQMNDTLEFDIKKKLHKKKKILKIKYTCRSQYQVRFVYVKCLVEIVSYCTMLMCYDSSVQK